MNGHRVVAPVLALVVLAASLAPISGGVSTAVGTGLGADKLLHAVGYAALTWTVASAVGAPTVRRLAAIVLVVTAFGAGVELVQPLVGRTASLLDALANLAGAVAGGLWAFSRSRLSA